MSESPMTYSDEQRADQDRAALYAEVYRLRRDFKQRGIELVEKHELLMKAERELAEARELLLRIAKPLGFGTMDGGMFVSGEDVAAIRAFLTPSPSAPAEVPKCNCDDHDARYCVNRASREVPCVCACHR